MLNCSFGVAFNSLLLFSVCPTVASNCWCKEERGLDVRSCYCWQFIATAVSNQQQQHHHQLPLFQLLTRRYHGYTCGLRWRRVEERGREEKKKKNYIEICNSLYVMLLQVLILQIGFSYSSS